MLPGPPNGNGVQRPHPGERPGVARCNDGLAAASQGLKGVLVTLAAPRRQLPPLTCGANGFDDLLKSLGFMALLEN
jgi:hypothetical protein